MILHRSACNMLPSNLSDSSFCPRVHRVPFWQDCVALYLQIYRAPLIVQLKQRRSQCEKSLKKARRNSNPPTKQQNEPKREDHSRAEDQQMQRLDARQQQSEFEISAISFPTPMKYHTVVSSTCSHPIPNSNFCSINTIQRYLVPICYLLYAIPTLLLKILSKALGPAVISIVNLSRCRILLSQFQRCWALRLFLCYWFTALEITSQFSSFHKLIFYVISVQT